MTTPIDKRDQTDPGDQVLRKFRYQHAYGVILVVAMVTKNKAYTAIWCEQHEDLLAEREDGFFDAYQVKTRKSETGEWELNDELFSKSIGRFVALDKKFPEKIHGFYFVSNTQYSDSNAKKREHLSPIKLIKAVHLVSLWGELEGKVLEGFECLIKATEADADDLFSVIKRLDITLGPTERAYEDEVCQRHISTLPQCKSASAPALAKVRESLIALMARAASLDTNDPSRDWVGLTKGDSRDPYLIAKRIKTEDVILAIRDAHVSGIHFPSELASIDLGVTGQKQDVLQKKMSRGGLAARYETMRRRSITAEQELLDLATRSGSEKEKCSQIENVVLGECDDAHLRASTKQLSFGSSMLIDVQDRLKLIAETDPEKVHHVPYEVLVGVAGLLTSECKVWWSEVFKLEDKQ